MQIVGRGRDADVYAVSATKVLRRYRDQTKSTALEARAMQFARERGLPVPEVYEADGPDIVMQRVDGQTMADLVLGQPWRYRREARRLADLHRAVHAVTAADWLPRACPGTTLVHLDLHPQNVILAADGPVIIDWANAAAGSAGLDTADTWLVLSAGRGQGPALRRWTRAAIGRWFAGAFEAAAGGDLREWLRPAAERRLVDRNITPAERDRVRRLLSR